MNSDNDEALSIARVRVLPGQTTKLHALKGTVERYVILNGQALVTVGSKETKIKEKAVISIAPDQPQKIYNTGQQDLIFLAICTPRFLQSNYYEC